ncbi:MAG TPA: hypothetical protein VGD60_06745 [Candidatus Acidoferrales bacterium]
MTLSAAFMAALGLAATFLPQEIAARYGASGAGAPLTLLIQIAGALYLAFAILNWMVRNSPIGGIYNRPLALANVVHFAVAAITLLKAELPRSAVAPFTHSPEAIAATILYSVFAIWFGLVLMSHPIQK